MTFLGSAGMARGDPYARIRVVPRPEVGPQIWVLGSSLTEPGSPAAGGAPFAFAHHFGGGGAETAFQVYRENFRPREASMPPPP